MDDTTYLDPTASGKRDFWAFGISYGLPALIALLLVIAGLRIQKDAVAALLGAFSVLAGLLFNLLVLLLDVIPKPVYTPETPETERQIGHRKAVRRETYQSLAYAILVSLMALVLLSGLALLDGGVPKPLLIVPPVVVAIADAFVHGVTLFLTGHFVLTLFLILKRINTLASKEVV